MNRAVGYYKQHPEWANGPARVEDGYVILDEARATQYLLYNPENLLFDLLGVYAPDSLDSEDVKAFVRRYGLLYHGIADIGNGRCRESLEQWHDDLTSLNFVARLWLDLVEAEKSGPTQKMREAFALVENPGYPEPTDEEWLKAFSFFLAEQITEGMEGTKTGLASTCYLDVEPKSPTKFLLLQRPANLITAAYSQFAFLVANKAPITTCPGCGRLFVPESGKQKYHSKSCASTNRWRKWKERQAE